MLSNLHELIPGADLWPHFVRNMSEQFEARVAMVEVQESQSVFLQGMAGSRMPIAVAHGEGRAEFADQAHLANLQSGATTYSGGRNGHRPGARAESAAVGHSGLRPGGRAGD